MGFLGVYRKGIGREWLGRQVQRTLKGREIAARLSPWSVPYKHFVVWGVAFDDELADREGWAGCSRDYIVEDLCAQGFSAFDVTDRVGPWGHFSDSDSYIESKAKRAGFSALGLEPQQVKDHWREMCAEPDETSRSYSLGDDRVLTLRLEGPSKRSPCPQGDVEVTRGGEVLERDDVLSFIDWARVVEWVTRDTLVA